MPVKYHGSACKTCRKRGRKCTRELPKCQSCLNKGITCEGYPLKWAGLASRGRLAGRSTNSSNPWGQIVTADPKALDTTSVQKRKATVSQPLQIIEESFSELIGSAQSTVPSPAWITSEFDVATSVCDIDNANDFDAFFARPESDLDLTYDDNGGITKTQVPSPLDPYNIPSELKFIINYHLIEVSPRLCVDITVQRNPYTEYIHPLAVQKPQLLYACAALAAVHFSTRRKDPLFYVESLRLKGKALRRLQEFMWSERSATDEGNLATILMLILCDMCLGGHTNFDAHFKTAKRLIDLRAGNRTQDNFVEQYISWLDVMSSATASRQAVFSSTDIKELQGSSTKWSHDVVPCPPKLFEILLEIVQLYKTRRHHIESDLETRLQLQEMKARLLKCSAHTERGMYRFHLTEAYRHAIILYMIRLFKWDVDEDEMSWLVQSIFYHSKATPASSSWSDQLLWPLYHVALEIKDERRQCWLRERFSNMQLSGGFRNVEIAMGVLEKVWKGEIPIDYTRLIEEDLLGDMLVV